MAANLDFCVVTFDPATKLWQAADDNGEIACEHADRNVCEALLTLMKAGGVPAMVQSAAAKAAESITSDTPKKGRNLRFVATEETVIRAGQPGYKRAARVRQLGDSVFNAGLEDDIHRIVYDTLVSEGDAVAKSLCSKYVSDYLKRRAKV